MAITTVRHSIISICVLCIIGLTAVAIWDVASIISDYIENNRVTMVKMENATADGFPFLDNPQICLYYNRSLLPFNGSEIRLAMNSIWRQPSLHSNSTYPINITSLLFLRSSYYIYWFDLGNDDELSSEATILNITLAEYKSMLDTVISNPNAQTIIAEAWELVKSYFVSAPSEYLGDENSVFDEYSSMYWGNNIVTETICFYLPISEVMKRASIVLYPLANTEMIPADWKFPAPSNISVRFATSIKNISLPINMKVTIANMGKFDKTRLPPCYDQFSITAEAACLDNIRRQVIEEICMCVPFSSSLEPNNSLPFCTSDIYSECWDDAEQEIDNRQDKALDGQTCDPCVTSKNIYVFSTETVLTGVPYQAILQFECTDKTYLVFESRPQLSMAQLISQVGGDLGLYIGLSMISFIQFFLFLYHMSSRSGQGDRKPDYPPAITSAWEKLITLSQQCMRYMDLSFDDVDREEFEEQIAERDRLEKDFHRHTFGTKNRFETIEERLENMENRLESILSIMAKKRIERIRK